MPAAVQNAPDLVSLAEIKRLWAETLAYTHHDDQEVTIRFIEAAEIQRLNRDFRQHDKPTNILTFSYGEGVHDLAVCLAIVEREAVERSLAVQDYLALVLVHGFLHAVGLDHEHSAEEARETAVAEQKILQRAGFKAIYL